MENWSFGEQLASVLGAKEWIKAEIRANVKTSRFKNIHFDLLRNINEVVRINIEAKDDAIQIESESPDKRRLRLALSHSLMRELMRIYLHHRSQSANGEEQKLLIAALDECRSALSRDDE